MVMMMMILLGMLGESIIWVNTEINYTWDLKCLIVVQDIRANEDIEMRTKLI